MQYRESGISLDFGRYPDTHFRWETNTAYRKLSGQSIKEIDFGWWDGKYLNLLELKDYTRAELGDNVDKLLDNLTQKSVDTLIMLQSIWLNTPTGKQLAQQLPNSLHKKVPIRIFHLINVTRKDVPTLLLFNSKLTNRFKGYQQLFNIQKYTALPPQAAQQLFPDIIS